MQLFNIVRGAASQNEWMTVGLVASRWDKAPNVSVATWCGKIRTSDIEALSKKCPVSTPDLVTALAHAVDENLHINDPNMFAQILAAYLGRTQSFRGASLTGQDGIWMKLLTRGSKSMARPVMVTQASAITEYMEQVQHRPEELAESEKDLLVFSCHADDRKVIGKVAKKIEMTTLDLNQKNFALPTTSDQTCAHLQAKTGSGKTSGLLARIKKYLN